MKIFLPLLLLTALLACQADHNTPSGFEPVSFLQVEITSPFWKAKIDSNRQNGIPGCFESAAHSLENFDIAAGLSDSIHKGTNASDSDVYKIIQGAAHTLDHQQDPELERFIDDLIGRIGAAQEPNGYLFTPWSIADLSKQWTQTKTQHELYCAGHFFEAAADYYEVTGKREILDIAERLAHHIDSVFGPGKLEEVSGHQEIELALIRLFEVTDNQQYLDLAKYFLDERGNPSRLAKQTDDWYQENYPGTPMRWLLPAYRQDHLPLSEQREATGHAVRAAYLYRAMSDYARVAQSHVYDEALNALWNDIVTKRIYITGSIGTAQFHDEGFGSDYNLPTASAYCETCSAIALMFWNQSMTILTGEAKFADLFEITLYNGGISGGSSHGDHFFYTNPLEGEENHHRQRWYEPGCCPSNFVRFIPMIDQFIYGQKDQEIVINQFIGSVAHIQLTNEVRIEQETNYPWNNSVLIHVDPSKADQFAIKLRIPGWTRGQFMPGDLYTYSNDDNQPAIKIKVNGADEPAGSYSDGYLTLKRKWTKGDQIEMIFPLESRLVQGRPEIEAVRGQQVLTRGPVVFCLESIDNEAILTHPENFKYTTEPMSVLAENQVSYGVESIQGKMRNQTTKELTAFTAIPYFSWNNRGPARMRVWF